MDKSPEARKIPDYIGPYKIESLLEKGGMSYLYLGTHPETRDPTTIKVLSPKYVQHPEVVRRFLNEAEIIAMADHPNIIKLYGHGEWEGGLYIAMEFVQGISLRQYILQTPMSLKKALEMIIDIAYALCHLHTHGVIHRDLKPENILISDTGILKVIDFGIAQLLTETTEEKAKNKQGFIGTPIYMSPEQRDNPENVGYPSDIYSLGIIAYELIMGKLSLGQVHLSLVPRGLQKILAKALQPNPNDRYQDIVDFITDISAYLHSNALEKEKLAGDHLSELAENLKEAYKGLYPPPPIWQGIECGYLVHKAGHHAGGFFDFIVLPDGNYLFLAGEAVAEGVKGIVYSSIMRGMAKGIITATALTPEDLLIEYQRVLCADHMDSLFATALLIFDIHSQKVHYASCGYGELLLLKKDSPQFEIHSPHYPLIGLENLPNISYSTHVLEPEDILLFIAYVPQNESAHTPPTFLQEEWWIQPFQDKHIAMQKNLENAYRRAKAQGLDFLKDRAVNFVAFLRQASDLSSD